MSDSQPADGAERSPPDPPPRTEGELEARSPSDPPPRTGGELEARCPSDPPPRTGGELEALLSALCRATGQPRDATTIKESLSAAAREQEAPLEGPAWGALVAAAERLGLRVHRVRWTPLEAACEAGERPPLVAWTRGGWAVLAGGGPRGVRIERPAHGGPDEASEAEGWVSKQALADLLGAAGPDDAVDIAIVVLDRPAGGLARDAGEGRETTPFRRLVGLLRPERSDLRSVVVFSIAVGLLNLAVPIAVEALVDMVAFGGPVQPVVVLSLILMICLSLGAALYALEAYVVELIQRRLFVRIVSDLAERLPRVQAAAIDGRHGPELVNRFFDTVTLQKAGSKLLLGGVSTAMSAAIGLVVLAFYHPFLLAFDLVLIALLFGIAFLLGRGALTTSLRESTAKFAAADWLEELLRHPGAFRDGPGRGLARERADRLAGAYLDRRMAHYRIVFRQLVAALALQVVASTVVLALGGWLVTVGELTLGQLVASWIIVSLVLTSVAKLGGQFESIYDVLTASEKLGSLVDLPLEREGGEGHTRAAGAVRLRFEGVSYAYGEGRPALRALDLALQPGERALLVGPAGSGKSTLLELAYGLRSPGTGRIELDGVDLRHLRLETLRDRVALARPGEVVTGTLLDNVRLGRESITQDEVRDLLDRLGLLETVRALPDGLATRVTPEGRPLSAGHAGLLPLARALAGRPQLVLVDGVLDGLEPAARDRALDVLCAEGAPWTLLLVSHHAELAPRFGRRVDLERATVESAA